MNKWLKLPGVFHRSELEAVIEIEGTYEYTFLRVGYDNNEQALVAIYCRVRCSDGVPVVELVRAGNAVFDVEPITEEWP